MPHRKWNNGPHWPELCISGMTFCGRTRYSRQIFLKSLCEARHLACNACGNADVDVYAAAFYPYTPR